MSEALKTESRGRIVETWNFHDLEPAAIKDDNSIFKSGVRLDSIDSPKLRLSIEKSCDVEISRSEGSRKALAHVDALAAFILEHQSA